MARLAEGVPMSPVVAAAVADIVRHRTTTGLRRAAAEVPPDAVGEFREFLCDVALELARLGSPMVTEVLELRKQLKDGA